MFAYFNELSANGTIQNESLNTAVNMLVECLKSLKEYKVNGVHLDKKIGQYQLTENEWFIRVLDDKSIVDADMKALILGMMTTIENPMENLEQEYFMSAMCNGMECIGLGLASEEVSNTFSVSLSHAGWDETDYQIELGQLTNELETQIISTTCKNISNVEAINTLKELFAPIPESGKELFLRLSELFPNLVFSSKAKEQIKKNYERTSVEQIFLKLQDIEDATKKLNGGDLRKELFHYKASPEHQQRSQLPEMNILFEDGETRHCEWHLRYTPGCGRIHFSADKGDGHTIYIGYVSNKIGIH